jgi:uncharacterized protein (TIGR00730 family)
MFLRILFDSSILLTKLFKVSFQIVRGVWKVYKLQQPIVTIFGSAQISQSAEFSKQAHKFGHELIEENISVITGGGPGIMQAATCGAVSHKKNIKAKTLSITVRGLSKKEPVNPCAHDYLIMDYFFARKWLMINYSVAFIVFPGGFGTLDEFAEVMTLLQTKKLLEKSVILIDSDYWQPIIDWVEQCAIPNGIITKEERDIIYITNDLDDALKVLLKNCKECMQQGPIRIAQGNL